MDRPKLIQLTKGDAVEIVKIHTYLEHQNNFSLGFMGCKQTWSGISQAVGSLAQTANSTDEYLRLFDIHRNIGKCGYFIT